MTRRNKVDGQGKHPWKAEVSEDDAGVSPTVITGWYDEVYERPTQIRHRAQAAKVKEGLKYG